MTGLSRPVYFWLVLGLFSLLAVPAQATLDGVLDSTGNNGNGQGDPPNQGGPAPVDPDPEKAKAEVDRLVGSTSDDANNAADTGLGGGLSKIGRDITAAIADHPKEAGLAALLLIGVSLAGYALASRYVDPKIALRNPQRSMLYGFVKGNPGVHLKQLSGEFRMKTSTVLWHVRKLEAADLVRSKKANGYRVFYPVSGGMEARQVSEAVTALSNGNARSLFEYIANNPGAHPRLLSQSLGINAGTIRWHLKKLHQAGLVNEDPQLGHFTATDLGLKALRQAQGLSPAPMEVATMPVATKTTTDEVTVLN